MALNRTNRGSYGGGGTAFSTNTSTSAVTPSFTPSDNSLLVVAFVAGYAGTSVLANFTISGGGLTWTERIAFQTTSDGENTVVKVWTAPVTTGASMQITITTPSMSNAERQAARMLYAFDYTGYDTTSPIGASVTAINQGSGAVSISLSAAPAASSEVLAFCANVPSGATSPTATPASGWTEIYDTAYNDRMHAQCQARSGSTSTSVDWDDVSVGDTVFGDDSVAFALEIKAAAIAAAARSYAQIIG